MISKNNWLRKNRQKFDQYMLEKNASVTRDDEWRVGTVAVYSDMLTFDEFFLNL